MLLIKLLRRVIPITIIVGFLAAMPSIGLADTITFNLEGQAVIASTTSISDTQNGLTLSVHRQDNGSFSIEDLTPFVPAGFAFGSRTISNFNGPFVAPGSTLVLNFSAPLTGGSISFGDFDGDDDSPVTLTAFSGLNGTGANLGGASVAYPIGLDFGTQGNAAIGTLTVSATGIQSVTISSGGPFPGSLFFDNIVATTTTTPVVPEPGSVVLLGSGLVALVVSRRFKRGK